MAKGEKFCPACNKGCGCRSLKCPACGHDFGIIDRKIATGGKPGTIHVVSSTTTNKFAPKKIKRRKKRIQEKVDWRTLDVGDKIKVLSGGGQRHIGGDGSNIPMGYKGKFIVKGVRPDGILAYSGNEGGFCFIHMGPKRQIDEGILLRPHKILLIEKRPERILSNAV